MSNKSREQERRAIFNQMMFMLQLGIYAPSTFGNFERDFAERMKSAGLGELTEDDINYLYTSLDSWNKHCEKENAEAEKKERAKQKAKERRMKKKAEAAAAAAAKEPEQ